MKLLNENFKPVNLTINESWYEDEVEATLAAYGLDEIEIDLILNDPDISQEIQDAAERGFDAEKTALYLLQQADEKGLVPNEQDISEYDDEEEHPAGEWQRQEQDRRFQRDDELMYDPEDECYLDEGSDGIQVVGQKAQRILDLVSTDQGSPSVRDVVSFIVKNWEEVTETPKSEMYAEQDFPDEILEIMDFFGMDEEEFTSEWEMATEREFEEYDDGEEAEPADDFNYFT